MALTDNLLGHWKLNEASGSRADSHNSNDLTDNNTVGSATGKIDDAANFIKANSEWLSLAYDAANDIGGHTAFAFAFWLKADTASDFETFLSLGTNTTGGLQVRLRIVSSKIQFLLSTGAAVTTVASTGSISTGTWYFIVVWHDPDADTINVQIDNGTPDSAAHTGGVNAITPPLELGRLGNASAYFDGLLDSVSWWKRILTTDEKTELYNSGSGLDYEGFAGGTTFNESGDLSAIPSLTSSETLTLSESGTLSAIPTLTGDQTVSLSGVGDLSAIPSLTADQTITANESGDLSGIPSLTGDVANAFDESATLSGIPSLTGDHTYTLQGGSALSAVPSLTADQTVTMNLSGELSAIPSLTGVDTGLAGVTAFNGGGRSEFVGPPARSSQFRSGRNNVSEFRTGRWVN